PTQRGPDQGNGPPARALLDRLPIDGGAEGDGDEPAEKQGDLPTLRSDGRAGVARRHPGDAGGPVGGEKGMMRKAIAAAGLAALSLSARPPATVRESFRVRLPACDPGNAGLTLPEGFCAVVVADQVGTARHLVVAPNGDLFVAIA